MVVALFITMLVQESGPDLPPPDPVEATKSVPAPALPGTDTPTKTKATQTEPDIKPALNPYPPVPGRSIDRRIELSPKVQKFIRDLALIAIPDEFEDDKKWGTTKKVQSGLSVRFKDGQLRTNRKWKEVKHGRWQKYVIRMIEPEQRFQLRISNVVKSEDGTYHFDITCFARLQVQARWQNWRMGVPMLRLSTEALTDIRLDARCELKMDFDYSAFPPSVQLKPVVRAADIRIGKFEVKRLGHIKGRVADEFSGAIRSALKREISRRRKDLPKKINKKIAKKEDDLKISVGEWLRFSKEDTTTAKKRDAKGK